MEEKRRKSIAKKGAEDSRLHSGGNPDARDYCRGGRGSAVGGSMLFNRM
jgi:hypothetical protein